MSEELEAQSDVKKKVQFDLDYKESIVDIYMSTESLRVHDRPWVEATPPTPPRHADSPPSVSFGGENSRRSPVQVFLAVMCLILTIWIIILTVQERVDRNNLERVNRLLSNLTEIWTSSNGEK